jgi:trk system potassium uptake protein TrkA
MYVIVVGGGKVGFYLAKTLLAEGHEVILIERDPVKSATLSQALNTAVLQGDGAEAELLEQAGMGRADVAVAVTGEDEDNLVVCQVAKRKFNVPRTIARINNPKNEAIFKKLGIDVTVSSTDAILAQIEAQIPAHSLVHLLTLRAAGAAIVNVKLAHDSPAIGRPLRELSFPQDANISLIVRGSTGVVPHGDTVMQAGDDVIAVTSLKSEDTLRTILVGKGTGL